MPKPTKSTKEGSTGDKMTALQTNKVSYTLPPKKGRRVVKACRHNWQVTQTNWQVPKAETGADIMNLVLNPTIPDMIVVELCRNCWTYRQTLAKHNPK